MYPAHDIQYRRFLECEAVGYGDREAIMITNFRYWLKRHRREGRHYHKGRYWLYNSIANLMRIFPYWTEKQIRHTLDSLVKQNVLVRDRFSTSRRDRTWWYAFADDAMLDVPLPEEQDSSHTVENAPDVPQRAHAEQDMSAPKKADGASRYVRSSARKGKCSLPQGAAHLPAGSDLEGECNRPKGHIQSPHRADPFAPEGGALTIQIQHTDTALGYTHQRSVCEERTHTREDSPIRENAKSQALDSEGEYFLHLCPARLRETPEFERFWRNFVRSYNRLAGEKRMAAMNDVKADNMLYRLASFRDPIGALNAATAKELMDVYDQHYSHTTGHDQGGHGSTGPVSIQAGYTPTAYPTTYSPEFLELSQVYHENPALNAILVCVLPRTVEKWLTCKLRERIRENPDAARRVERMLRKRYPDKAAALREHFNFLQGRGYIEVEPIEPVGVEHEPQPH